MQIGELSARTGATVRMLRYYEEHGPARPRSGPSPATGSTPSPTCCGSAASAACSPRRCRPAWSPRRCGSWWTSSRRPGRAGGPGPAGRGARRPKLDTLTERIAILQPQPRATGRLPRRHPHRGGRTGPPGRPATPDIGPAVRQGAPVRTRTQARAT